MCGIIAVVRRPGGRIPPTPDELWARLDAADSVFGSPGPSDPQLAERIEGAATHVEELDRLLRGAGGVRALLADRGVPLVLETRLRALQASVETLEAHLDALLGSQIPHDLERINAAIVRLKDGLWAVLRDRLRTAAAVDDLAGRDAGPAAVDAFTSVQLALSAIDRLEVRGRDSAGLHVLVRGHGLDLTGREVQALLAERVGDPLFSSGAVRTPDGLLAFVYKAAAEIGELGDNTRALRTAIRNDALLQRALAADTAEALVLGHTRWASVGIISEANAHPLTHEETGADPRPYATAVLNGDVDNYADLKALEGLVIAPEITTDAKVIPALLSRRLASGADPTEAFRETVSLLEGSVAIASSIAAAPDHLLLALRGSGQALYVGLTEDAYVVASEPYGLVEVTSRYVRMDGETPADPSNPTATRGQVVVLDGARAGTLDGIRRLSYDGTELPVGDDDVNKAEITTRDIDRGDFPHFLLKEISEAPASFRKTMRGKVRETDGRLVVAVGDDVLPAALRDGLRSGRVRRVVVIGQGTAAVAARSMAGVLRDAVPPGSLLVDGMPATELSGFRLDDDMSDALVVAISQSGTTTDTNRTVDLARSRGATVVAIVNRRNSDLTDKADGVLYTSDGRDVEMAVPSTKAFYSQIAAGFLLADAIADAAGLMDADRHHQLLSALRELPDAMQRVLERRAEIGAIAQQHAPPRRYWAVVGNGANRLAAEEIRIKLSELCYKSISCDATEDKKHIDLSSEPLILVCAAGLSGSNADDVAKEVAIYRAHKAAPLVIATEGENRFPAALAVMAVPDTDPALAFVLSAMAGHLFGYEAALAIDGQARPLREARAALESVVAGGGGLDVLDRLGRQLEAPAARFFAGLRSGAYDGHLEASTAVRMTSLLRYATGVSPLETYQLEYGKVGTPDVVVEDLIAALTQGIEELTRPIDAIKHQAKTVTVGISRADEALVQVGLVREVLAAGAARDRLSYRALRTLAALDPAVDAVSGYTRYRVEGDPVHGTATVQVLDKGGIARDIPSRADQGADLRGTKRRVAAEREVTVARGRDGRTLLIVPEVKDNQSTGLTLLHVNFHDGLPAGAVRSVLEGYRGRYAALRDAVTEFEPSFRDDLLAGVPLFELLTEPVVRLAERWRSA